MLDLAEEDRMIAAVEGLEEATLKSCERARKNRDAVLINGMFDAGELVLDQRGEVLGDASFVRCENVYRKSAGLLECVMAAGNFLDTDKDKRRIERDRTECRNRNAELLTFAVFCCNDSDAARKSRQG